MRYINQILIAFSFCFSPLVHAIDTFAELLYWQASESAEWALTNNLNPTTQVISYKTISFDFAPGVSVGIEDKLKDFGARFYYTHYNVGANDSTQGTVIPAFQAGKFTQKFSNAAQVNFAINYNMMDVDLYKTLQLNPQFVFRPVLGLKGGWINQNIHTYFQGQMNYIETIHNNFTGVGPKAGIESNWLVYAKETSKIGFFANFSTAYLWGNWFISDNLSQSNSSQINQMLVGKRDFGAFMIDGKIGLNLSYQSYGLKVAYEVADWFNQFQVFDNRYL